MDWTYDNYWNKSLIYIERALDEKRDGPLFPFWAIIALEFLGRATLSFVSPILLADPREDGSVMYAAGYNNQMKSPKTIPAKTLFSRCSKIAPLIGEEDIKFLNYLMELRNVELHSSIPAFEDQSQKWLAQYYSICSHLLSAQNKALPDWLGKNEAEAAEEMIKEASVDSKHQAMEEISKRQKYFENLTSSEKEVLIEKAEKRIYPGPFKFTKHVPLNSKFIKCPSCSYQKALLVGKQIDATSSRVDSEGYLTRNVTLLPVYLECYCCGLKLNSLAELNAIDLGGQFTSVESVDPVEFFQIDPIEYLDADDIQKAYHEQRLYDEYGNE